MAAHKLHEIIKRIFEWAHGRDEIDANPMSGKWAPVNKTPRDRVLILSHGPRDPLVRTYNVHAYQDEKREALEKWAGHIRDLVEPPPKNVVQLATAGEAK